MKKHFLSILIAAAAISSIFSACNKEVVNSNDSQENSGLVSFVATIDDAATKTTIDGTKVYWKTGDEVCVNGYNISDVDNFIEELIDRLESAKASNTIVYVPRPDFDQIRRSKHLFVLPQKGYNKVEVEK